MNNYFSLKNLKPLTGFQAFRLGVLLIIPLPLISIILFLYALIIKILVKRNYLKDKWNWPIILTSFLMLLSLITKSSSSFYQNYDYLNQISAWLDIMNWFPFFLIFWYFQDYMSTLDKRKEVIKSFLLGTILVITFGIGQTIFNWEGVYIPILGFPRLVNYGDSTLTGVFNNPNIAGLWICLGLPFALALLKKNNSSFIKRFLLFFLVISILFTITATFSRNAIFGLFISYFFILKNSFLIFLPLFSIIIFIYYQTMSTEVQKIVIDNVINKFFGTVEFNKNFSFSYDYFFSYPRLKIWIESLSLTFQRPFFGWGGSNFPIIYDMRNSEWYGHTHNIILELAFNYGIPCALVLSLTMMILLLRSFNYIFKLKNFNDKIDVLDKAWWVAGLITLVVHLTDIPYYDGRISLISWIIFIGLKSIISENKKVLN